MGTIKYIVFGIFLFTLSSCGLLGIDSGYTDKNEQYVPKHPRFKLKDKPRNRIPVNLDTLNIYRLQKRTYNGIDQYPFKQESNEYYGNDIVIFYLKFYNKGRCLSFSIPEKDKLGNINQLKEADLNPNNKHYSKNYFFSEDSQKIDIESFSYGTAGQGTYIMLRYTIDTTGDSIVYNEGKTELIYIKEKIPSDWNTYNADW